MVATKPQCEFCAFHKLDDQSTPEKAAAVEEKFRALRGTKGAPRKTRVINASNTGVDDRTYTCKTDSPNWPKQLKSDEYCEDFIENDIGLAEALRIRETKALAKAIDNPKHIQDNIADSRHHWYKRPIGIIGLTVIAGLILAGTVYLIKTYLGIKL